LAEEEEAARQAIPAPSPDALAKWGDKKMSFSNKTGASDIAYSGGRSKSRQDVTLTSTAAQVLTLQRVLGAMSPQQTSILPTSRSGLKSSTLSLLERDGVHASKLTVEGEEKQAESSGPFDIVRKIFTSPFKIAPTLGNSLHHDHDDDSDDEDIFSGVTPQAVQKQEASIRKVINMRELKKHSTAG